MPFPEPSSALFTSHPLPSSRLPSLLSFLCGTLGIRLPPLSQTRGSPPAAAQPPPAWRLRRWMSCTQLLGRYAGMQRWAWPLAWFLSTIRIHWGLCSLAWTVLQRHRGSRFLRCVDSEGMRDIVEGRGNKFKSLPKWSAFFVSWLRI